MKKKNYSALIAMQFAFCGKRNFGYDFVLENLDATEILQVLRNTNTLSLTHFTKLIQHTQIRGTLRRFPINAL